MELIIIICLIIAFFIWLDKTIKKDMKVWTEQIIDEAEQEYQEWRDYIENGTPYENETVRKEILFRARYERERLGK